MLFPESGGESIALLEYKPVYGVKSTRSTSGKTKSRAGKASKKITGANQEGFVNP
jgi:hypothetical protein